MKMPRVNPGDDIRAEHVNAIYEAAEGLGLTVDASSGLSLLTGPGGKHLGVSRRFRGWIKLTSNSGTAYAWTQQVAASGGTWTSGGMSGTTSADPAYPANGETTIAANTIVWAERAPTSGTIVFVY